MHHQARHCPTIAQQVEQGVAIPERLHLTIKPMRFWLEVFERHGFVLHHTLEDSEAFKWLKRQYTMCCSFVLVRRGLPLLPPNIDANRRDYLRSMWWPPACKSDACKAARLA